MLKASNITRSFNSNGVSTPVLNGVDLSVAAGESVAVMGPSGSGKSTLLYCVSGMDTPDSGKVLLAGTELSTLSPTELADFRREQLGFVFQQPTLLKDLTILENIILTSALDRQGSVEGRIERARSLLERAGIPELEDRLPAQVSGGQLQRAGICRALMRDPKILFADEPTGALNVSTAAGIMDLLGEFNQEGLPLLVVTHDVNVAARAQRVVFMVDGRIVNELKPSGSDPATLLLEGLQAAGI